MLEANSIKLAIVDDHKLFRKGLISLIEMINDSYQIIFEAQDGVELQKKIEPHNPPDIIIMDVNMPNMDGFGSVEWLRQTHPEVHVLVLSMIEKEEVIVKMLKMGVKGYLCKDVEPKELQEAIESIYSKGFYYTDFITGKLVHSIQKSEYSSNDSTNYETLKDREKEFLQLACSEMTYAQIADRMYLSPKTIDGYRNALFEKFNVKNRVGLALLAVKRNWVKI